MATPTCPSCFSSRMKAQLHVASPGLSHTVHALPQGMQELGLKIWDPVVSPLWVTVAQGPFQQHWECLWVLHSKRARPGSGSGIPW